MDDGELDDLVKKKLGNYVDPVYDEGAFDDLAGRLVVAPAPTFFARHWASMALAATVILSGINIYLYLQRGEVKTIVTNTVQYDSLVNVIHELREAQTHAATIQRIEVPEEKLPPVAHTPPPIIVPVEQGDAQSWLGYSTQSSDEILKALLNARVVVARNDSLFINHENARVLVVHSINHRALDSYESPLATVNGELEPIVVTSTKSRYTPMQVSNKVRNQLEKHYFKGIGIEVGPQAGLGVSSTNVGSHFAPRVGASVDWILSPRLSAETGAAYALYQYNAGPTPWGRGPNFYDHYYGSPADVMGTNHLIATPVGIKYRQWLNATNQFFVRGSFTPYWLVAGNYSMRYREGGNDPDDSGRIITQVQKYESRGFFGKSAGLTAGIIHHTENNRRIELGIWYDTNLGTFGKVNRIQTVGLQTSWWFKVRS